MGLDADNSILQLDWALESGMAETQEVTECHDCYVYQLRYDPKLVTIASSGRQNLETSMPICRYING